MSPLRLLATLVLSGCAAVPAETGAIVVCPEGAATVGGDASAAAIAARLDVAPDTSASVDGALRASAPRNPDGRPVDAWRIALRAGERVRIDLAGDFDAYLTVRPPAGATIENDDVAEGDLRSRVEFTVRVDGDYLVEAGAYAPEATGAYRLTFARGAAVPTPPRPTGPVIAAGVDVAGTLAPGDHTSADGKFEDELQFTGHRGDLVTIDLHSAAFDAYLTLRAPDGQVYESDDVSGANLDSRVQATLTADGPYAIEVSSFASGARGAYVVRLEQSARPRRVAGRSSDAPIVDVAGRTGHGRVFGVFVGIAQYGAESGDLPHCDDDATEIARVLRERGVQAASQQIVLTNAQATREAVRAAMATMATRVTPDDVLVFFYSGHGSQVAGTVGVAEPDGLDETIRLRGGAMTDDELAELVTKIHGTVLVALDSCHSGGFARDVVSGPGRIGVFASEEDVLSDTAGRYQAGGYLSYFLRLGLEGESDADLDGTVRVGELTDYLYARFGDHRAEMATTGNGGGSTFQHLIVARGSVIGTDLLFRYPE